MLPSKRNMKEQYTAKAIKKISLIKKKIKRANGVRFKDNLNLIRLTFI